MLVSKRFLAGVRHRHLRNGERPVDVCVEHFHHQFERQRAPSEFLVRVLLDHPDHYCTRHRMPTLCLVDSPARLNATPLPSTFLGRQHWGIGVGFLLLLFGFVFRKLKFARAAHRGEL